MTHGEDERQSVAGKGREHELDTEERRGRLEVRKRKVWADSGSPFSLSLAVVPESRWGQSLLFRRRKTQGGDMIFSKYRLSTPYRI